MDKKCETCGKMMLNVRRDRRFCGECAIKRKKEQKRKYSELQKAERQRKKCKFEKECSPSVRNCINCKMPAKYCTGGSNSHKCNDGKMRKKFEKVTSDEKAAIKDAKITENAMTVDMLHDAL